MLSTRVLPFALLAIAVGGLTTAQAKGPAPTWKLGDAKQRYDLRVEQTPTPAAPRSPRLAPFLLLGADSFQNARRPTRAVTDPGDLVWHFALDLPGLTKKLRGKRPQIVEVSESFAVPRGAFEVHGNHSVRRKGKRLVIRSSLVVTCTVPKHWLKKGNLVVQRQFNTKKGLLERASFSYEITSQTVDANKKTITRTDTWTGSILPAKPLKVLTKDFHVSVQDAIKRGRGWLLGATNKRLNGYKANTYPAQGLGRIALPTFALLRSGVSPGELKNLFQWMERQPFKETYSVALWVQVLEARSIRRIARPPQARTRTVARFDRKAPAKRDKKLATRAVRWLINSRKHGKGWWSYYGYPPQLDQPGFVPKKGPVGHDGKTVAKNGDRSNSQFAVLALHAGEALGVEIPVEVWREILDEALKSQQASGPAVSLAGSQYGADAPLSFDPRDVKAEPGETTSRKDRPPPNSAERLNAAKARGWAYRMDYRTPAGSGYGSMTCAGSSSLTIAREALRRRGKLDAKLDARSLDGVRDGLAWALHYYDVARNPKRGDTWYYYYTYSLEKAMDTAGVERLGTREWWRDVAAELLSRQADDGGWGTVEATSFALLVLNRATLPAKLEIEEAERSATGGRDLAAWDRVLVQGPKGRKQLSVRQLLNAMAASPHDAAQRLALARKAFVALNASQRPRLVPELVLLRNHKHKSTRRWARETCRLYAGTDKPNQLETFSERWEMIRLVGEGLRYGQIPQVRKVLVRSSSPLPLRRHALEVLAKLQAVETLSAVLDQLQHRDPKYRAFVWSQLIAMAGAGHPEFEPDGSGTERREQLQEWRTWWSKNEVVLLQREHVRRACADLAYPARAAAASKTLEKIGRPALRSLVDCLRDKATCKRAHLLLKKISGQKHPPKVRPWLKWLESQR